MQTLSAETLQGLLKNLYPEDSSADVALLSSQLLQILCGASANDDDAGRTDLWTGADAVLITYADTVVEQGVPALRSLRQLLNSRLRPFAEVVHVLPFLTSTSDGGFAVASHDPVSYTHLTLPTKRIV